jgi:hypothetical protein
MHLLVAPLQPQVANYALAMHGLASEAAKERSGAAGKEFRAAVATATARAMGARYKPEIAAAVKALPKKTADGLAIDFALDNLKVRVSSFFLSLLPHLFEPKGHMWMFRVSAYSSANARQGPPTHT